MGQILIILAIMMTTLVNANEIPKIKVGMSEKEIVTLLGSEKRIGDQISISNDSYDLAVIFEKGVLKSAHLEMKKKILLEKLFDMNELSYIPFTEKEKRSGDILYEIKYVANPLKGMIVRCSSPGYLSVIDWTAPFQTTLKTRSFTEALERESPFKKLK